MRWSRRETSTDRADAATTTSDPKPADEPATPATADPLPTPPVPATTDGQPVADIPARLISAARMVTVQHRQTSADPLTADELAARLGTSPAIAGHLLAAIDNPARLNGHTPALGGAR